MGVPGDDWPNSGGQGFSQPQRYEGMNNRGPRRPNNQNGHLPRSSGNYHSGTIPPPPPTQAPYPQPHNQPRRPAWDRNGTGPDTRLPPRPPTFGSRNSDDLNYSANDGHRSEEPDRDRDRGVPPPPRSNPGGSRPPPNIDTYIPNYGSDNRAVGRDRDRDRDRDRRDSYERDDRRAGGDRDRGYHDRDRDRRTRTRSRSPGVRGGGGGGGRDHREREPLSRERDTYRR